MCGLSVHVAEIAWETLDAREWRDDIRPYFEVDGRRASKPIVLPRVVVDLYSQCSNSQKID